MTLLGSLDPAPRRAPKRKLSIVWSFVALFGLVVGLMPAMSTGRAVAQVDCQTFSQTGKEVCGKFNTYWTENGGLAQ